MGAEIGDHSTVEHQDWVWVGREDWWHTDIGEYGLPPASFMTSGSVGVAREEGRELNKHLPGVRFAEQVLEFYEAAVGFHVSATDNLCSFELDQPPLPAERPALIVERDNMAAWSTIASRLQEEEEDEQASSSMSSSLATLRSSSLSDSERSATVYSPAPATPRATDKAQLHKDLPDMSLRAPSPILDFTFPTLNTTPAVIEIVRDDEGFIVPRTGSEHKPTPATLDDILPPFLMESMAKAKASTKSKTRTMVDKLRSSNRDSPAADVPTPSVHDLSFIKPRLGAQLDADEDDAGWIGQPVIPASQSSDLLMALANKARNAFLQGLKRGKSAETVLSPPAKSSAGKGKVRGGDQTSSDKDGWIEYPSLNPLGKANTTKDSAPAPRLSKRVPLSVGAAHHRRSTSHMPQPTIPQLVNTHRPSTSGTFVFPPPPTTQAQQQWTNGMPPPVPMFAGPVAPPLLFHGPPPPSMMQPPPAGWFIPTPAVLRPQPPPPQTLLLPTYRKPPHIVA